jgi:hypothetical protein
MTDFNFQPDLHLDLWPELQKPTVTPASTATPAPVVPQAPPPPAPRTRSGSGLSTRISTSMLLVTTDDPSLLSLEEIKRKFNDSIKERE